MIKNSSEKELLTKQEGGIGGNDKAPATSARSWSALKHPRIVRVSRLLGGKDRHSKVSTVRGLRDRRVRLSVPTAIQLYDLQDRLGLNQPSKVVDWLIAAAQHEIDKLPPLEFPPGSLLHSSATHHHGKVNLNFDQDPEYASDHINVDARFSALLAKKSSQNNEFEELANLQTSAYWNSEVARRVKQATERGGGDHQEHHGVQVLAHAPLHRPSNTMISGLLHNSMSYAPYSQWDPSNPYASHVGIHSSTLEEASINIPSSPFIVQSSMFLPYMAGASDQSQMESSASQSLLSNSQRNSNHPAN